MTVGQLQDSCTAYEIETWKVYYARKEQREELEIKKAEAKRGRR